MLTGRRADLVADRTRTVNRLRQQLTAICPALERAADPADQRGWVILLAQPMRYNRSLRRVMYLAALTADRCDPDSKAYDQRKRAEGRRPVQAIVRLARRRTSILWALIRDYRTWQPTPPVKDQAVRA